MKPPIPKSRNWTDNAAKRFGINPDNTLEVAWMLMDPHACGLNVFQVILTLLSDRGLNLPLDETVWVMMDPDGLDCDEPMVAEILTHPFVGLDQTIVIRSINENQEH